MRRISLILTMSGLAILLILLNFQNPVTITNPNNLTNLQQNQKLMIQGNVKEQTANTVYLDNGFELICDNCPNFLNKNITAIGILETWTGKPVIKVLKLST